MYHRSVCVWLCVETGASLLEVEEEREEKE